MGNGQLCVCRIEILLTLRRRVPSVQDTWRQNRILHAWSLLPEQDRGKMSQQRDKGQYQYTA